MIKMFLLKHFGIGTEKNGRILIYIYIGLGIIFIQWIVKLILLIKYDIHTV